MTWVEEQISDDSLFPVNMGQCLFWFCCYCSSCTDTPFPKHFLSSVKVIFKRLFRVYAHIYYSHFERFVSLQAEKHLNTCFKHFIFFVKEFDLIDSRELKPLEQLIANLMSKPAVAEIAEEAEASASSTAEVGVASASVEQKSS